MITEETAARIAYAYAEIKAAEKLLDVIRSADLTQIAPDFRDVFGRRRRALQLGVPSGESGHRLMDVSTALGGIIIQAHIDTKRAEIAALCELARGQLADPTS